MVAQSENKDYSTVPSEKALEALRAHQWKKGQTGNPGGRPKGLASSIREATRDGAELKEILLEVARSKDHRNDRLRAVELLLQRGWGKAPEIQLTGELSDEHVEALTGVDVSELVGALKTLRAPSSLVVDSTAVVSETVSLPAETESNPLESEE